MTSLQTHLIVLVSGIIVGFAVAFSIFGASGHSSSQQADIKNSLDNISNSVVELKTIMISFQNSQNGLINIIKYKYPKAAADLNAQPLFDEPVKATGTNE